MKLAIMQPYLFPYIGYFQLMQSVDTFVIYDNVNYIKKGFINRNRILLNGNEHTFNLNLNESSQFKKINEIEIGDNNFKLIKTIQQAYSKAPFYKSNSLLIEEILSFKEKNLAVFLENSIIKLAKHLNLRCKILSSSKLPINNDLKAQEKIIHICEQLKASIYINVIGGQDLYEREKFEDKGMTLKFIKSQASPYDQKIKEFIPNLSIIDVMMYNTPETIKRMLNQYSLI